MKTAFKTSLKYFCLVGISVSYAANSFASSKKSFTSVFHIDVPVTPTAAAPAAPAHLFQGEFSATDINSCITSICGPANANWGAFDVYADRLAHPSLSAQRVWQNELLPRVAQNLQDEKTNEVAIAQRLVAELNRPDLVINPSTSLKSLLSFLKAAALISPHIQDLISMTNYGYQVKPDALETALNGASDEMKVAARLMVKDLYLPLYNQSLTAVDITSQIANRLKTKYPKLSAKDAQKTDATMLLSMGYNVRRNVGGIIGGFLFTDSMETLFTEAKNGQDLNTVESDTYVDNATTLETMGSLFDGGELSQALSAIPFDATLELQNLRSSGFAAKHLADAQNIDTKAALAAISTSCQTRIANSLDMNASDLRYRKLQDLLITAKGAATTVASQMADGPYQAATVKAINAVEFALPETNTEHIQRLNQAITKEALTNQQSAQWNKDASPEMDQFILFVGLAGASGTLDKDEDLSKDSAIKDVCDALPVDSVSDYTLTSLGKISVSWFTAAYPEMGIGIAAHELGHVASHILRSQQIWGWGNDTFKQSLNCVANRNPFVMTVQKLSGFQNTTWSEEDFADHFSSLVMAELAKNKNIWYNDRNMACALVQDYGNYYGDSTLAAADGDVHSSGFLRLLMIAQDRQQTTPQCQNFLTSVTQAGRSLTCH